MKMDSCDTTYVGTYIIIVANQWVKENERVLLTEIESNECKRPTMRLFVYAMVPMVCYFQWHK